MSAASPDALLAAAGGAGAFFPKATVSAHAIAQATRPTAPTQ
jgi:hypothetical protein